MRFLYLFLAFLGLAVALPATSENPNHDIISKRKTCKDCMELAYWCRNENRSRRFPRPCATIVCNSFNGYCHTGCGYCKKWGPPCCKADIDLPQIEAEFEAYAATGVVTTEYQGDVGSDAFDGSSPY